MYRTSPHNEQAEWRGSMYPPQSPLMSLIGDYPQQTLIGWQGPNGNQPSGMNPSSQVPFLASYSDDLFNPTLRGPLVPNFSLPEVHFSQNSRSYQCPTDSCWIPVIPVDSSGFRRNGNWQRALPILSFRLFLVPADSLRSGIDTGMFPGIHQNGMQPEWLFRNGI